MQAVAVTAAAAATVVAAAAAAAGRRSSALTNPLLCLTGLGERVPAAPAARLAGELGGGRQVVVLLQGDQPQEIRSKVKKRIRQASW